MKRKFLLIVLGASLAGVACAQSTNPPPTNLPPANPPQANPPPTNLPPPHPPAPNGPPPSAIHHPDLSQFLTPEERQVLDAAHAAVIKTNPTLAAEEKDFMQKLQVARASGKPPDPALFAQMIDLRKKMHDAMLKIDPKVKPIFDKINAAMQAHGGPGGPGGPPPQQQGQQGQPPPQQQSQQGQPPPPPTNSAPSGH